MAIPLPRPSATPHRCWPCEGRSSTRSMTLQAASVKVFSASTEGLGRLAAFLPTGNARSSTTGDREPQGFSVLTACAAENGIPLPRRPPGTTIMHWTGPRRRFHAWGAKPVSTSPDANELVTELCDGNQRAADQLMPLVYEELRQLADSYLRRERPDHVLQPTALVHEAYLRLVDQTRADWQGKTHFKAVAAVAMHRALIDHARASKSQKRGGQWRPITLYDAFLLARPRKLDPLVLHEALDKMRKLDERQSRVVELRLFGGLSSDEIARVLGVSARTVERDWRMGQAWLRKELSEESDEATKRRSDEGME